MSIKFKCPACGQREVVADEMAGQKVECRQCGRRIRVPGGAADAARQSAAPGRNSAAPRTGDSQTSTAALHEQSDVPAPTYTCGTCGQSFGVSDVYDQQGTIICKACFAVQQAATGEGETAPLGMEEEPIACAACGSAIRGDQVEEWGGQLLCASCATLAAARPVMPSASSAKRPPVAKRPSPTPWIVGGVVGAVVVGVAVVAFVKSGSHADSSRVATNNIAPAMRPRATPQVPGPAMPEPNTTSPAADVLPRLVELRRQGLGQESANDLNAASATYSQMIELAKGATAPNQAVQQQLVTAQAALSAIKDRMAAATPAPTSPAVAVSPSPAPTGTTTTPPASDSSAPAADASSASTAAGGTWEQQHAAQVRALLKQAESRLAANDSFKATLAYQQLFQLVGTHLADIRDADLKRQVQAAAIARGKLLLQLKSSPESVRLTADTLLASGLAALHESHWQAGLESLADVRALFEKNIKLVERARDAKYLMALDGMAVAYLKTKQTPKAGELFDDSSPLGKAVDQDPNREMVINRAAVDIIQRTKAMRAAKSLKAYLEKHPGDAPDEELLNLFGTSLFIAEQHTTGKTKLEEYAVVYKRENDRLEKMRPGEKRWGVEWLPAREADTKMADRQHALDEFAKYSRQANAAYNDWQHTQELYNTFNAYGVRKASLGQVQAAERTFNGLSNAATDARKKIPDMTWLTQIEPVLPPLPAGITAVASAGPSDSNGTGGDAPPSVFTIPTLTLHDPPARSAPAEGSSDSTTPAAPKPPAMHISAPRHALAFPIDHARLVSSAEVIGEAKQVRLENAQGDAYSAHVLAKQDALVILELDAGQPRFSTYLSLADSFTGGPVQCSCIPQENVFGPQPASLSGQAGPPPAQGPWSVSLADHPRLAGSPLLNDQRQVVGVVIAKRDDVRTRLPAVGLAALREFLSAHSALAAAPSPAPDPLNVLEVTVQEE